MLELVRRSYLSDHQVDLSRPCLYHTALAHTRWATHGAPSAVRRPSSDDSNEFVVVHNGIITNHAELRDWLVRNENKMWF